MSNGCIKVNPVIPKFKLEFDDLFIENMKSGVEQILRSGKPLSNGELCRLFEYRFCEFITKSFERTYNSNEYGLAVGSGTDALECALRAVDVENKIVFISDNTMVAQALAVEKAGGIIYPIDIELQTLSMSCDLLAQSISENKSKEIGAVIITYIGGLVSLDLLNIMSLCRTMNIPFIQDAAHAIGTELPSYNTLICYSFFPTKQMTTSEGGMVLTSNPEYHKKMEMIRQFGWKQQGVSETQGGGNMKMTEIQALMGLEELKRVRDRIQKRQEINKIYKTKLEKNKYIPSSDGTISHVMKSPFKVYEQNGCSYYKTIVQLTDPFMVRDELVDHCKQQGIEMTGYVYDPPIHRQPIYDDSSLNSETKNRISEKHYPNTEYFSKHHVCPPNYPELTIEEVECICEVFTNEI